MNTPEWELAKPVRPTWEPLHFTDWQGERRARLEALAAELEAIDIAALNNDQVAARAIIGWLIRRGTVTIEIAKIEAARLATQRIPKRHGRPMRLSVTERSDI